ncbi:hypothetical protein KCU71_g10063, partial [Aureobasidium melanogenum]
MADATPEQPLRFLDLPRELRFMIYEELMDNKKNNIKFIQPKGFEVGDVYLDNMHYPHLLKVNKQIRDELPDINPFNGIADSTAELPNLKFIGIWSELEMSVIEYGHDEAERDERFQDFVQLLFLKESALVELDEEEDRNLNIRVDCSLYTPLFEMNKNYIWPRRRHLEQGVAPAAGLPEWGHSMFRVVAPWERPLDDSFTYRGEGLKFMRLEYELPVLPRSETECDSPSEWDYEFGESGFATGNIPDWSSGARPVWMDHE